MKRIPAGLTRTIAAVVVAAVVLGAVAFFLLGGSSTRKVTAYFSSGVGVYPGTPLKMLGVDVGQVTKVTPQGSAVKIEMSYDAKYKVPANAIAVIVANSLVSDRYLQLAPAYRGGPVMPDKATIPIQRTASPAELDDIYSALNQLSTALGPQGANKTGALSTLVDVASANLDGNGRGLGQSIQQLSKAAQTLANGRTDLFGTVKNLQVFTAALQSSDAQVRNFQNLLAQVAGDLADERGDLGAALKDLSAALSDVSRFVNDNSDKVHRDLVGLKDITGVLVKQKSAINESLAVGPVTLANVVHAYQENIGVIPTRGNLSSITDPVNLCGLFQSGGLLGTGNLLGPLTPTIASTCKTLLGSLPGGAPQLPSGVSPSALNSLLTSLLGGGGGLIGVTG